MVVDVLSSNVVDVLSSNVVEVASSSTVDDVAPVDDVTEDEVTEETDDDVVDPLMRRTRVTRSPLANWATNTRRAGPLTNSTRTLGPDWRTTFGVQPSTRWIETTVMRPLCTVTVTAPASATEKLRSAASVAVAAFPLSWSAWLMPTPRIASTAAAANAINPTLFTLSS